LSSILVFSILLVCIPRVFSDKHTSGSVNKNGINYEYTFNNGVEELNVKGHDNEDFNREKLLKEFRKSTGVTDKEIIETKITQNRDEPKSFLLFDNDGPVYKIIASISNIAEKTLFDITSIFWEKKEESQEEMVSDLESVFKDLSKVMEEESEINNKKAELNSFIKSSKKEKLKSIEKLVQGEIEKLEAQEDVIKGKKKSLLQEKEEIEFKLKIRYQRDTDEQDRIKDKKTNKKEKKERVNDSELGPKEINKKEENDEIPTTVETQKESFEREKKEN